MKLTQQIDWIFFDAGGVLLNETKHEEQRMSLILKVIQEYKPKITKDDISVERPKASAMLGGLTINIVKLLLPDKIQQESAIKKIKTIGLRADQCSYAFVRPEAEKIVERLSEKYNLGLLANQPVNTKEKLERAGVLKYFKFQEVSEDFKLRKPDPEFFKAIFKATGADSKKSVIIDDNIERGLIPAKKLGMTTIWFKLEDRDVPAGIVDYTVESLGGLLELFP
ncbi:MAG: HAD family hydrolase [Candidatus Buchananbacteria bacterium]|jgi:putative hydrolase of the HAD superfamily